MHGRNFKNKIQNIKQTQMKMLFSITSFILTNFLLIYYREDMLKVILFSVLENKKIHQISKGRDQLGAFFKEIRCNHNHPTPYLF